MARLIRKTFSLLYHSSDMKDYYCLNQRGGKYGHGNSQTIISH